MKHVGVREFRDRATGYFRGSEPIAVERHGRLIGFYIPVEPREPDHEGGLQEALDKLGVAVERALEESGMTEDELADYFNLSRKDEPEADERG